MVFICGKSQHRMPEKDNSIETVAVTTAHSSMFRSLADTGSSLVMIRQYDMASRTEIKYMIEHKKSMHQYLNLVMVVTVGVLSAFEGTIDSDFYVTCDRYVEWTHLTTVIDVQNLPR
jgi:hypothetical protein